MLHVHLVVVVFALLYLLEEVLHQTRVIDTEIGQLLLDNECELLGQSLIEHVGEEGTGLVSGDVRCEYDPDVE